MLPFTRTYPQIKYGYPGNSGSSSYQSTCNCSVCNVERDFKIPAVWNRFLNKYCREKDPQEIETINHEAKHLLTYVMTRKKNENNIAKIKSQLSSKVNGQVSDEAVYGKVYALALKVVNLLHDPQYLLGVEFVPTYKSKSGSIKPAAASRLLSARPIIYSAPGAIYGVQGAQNGGRKGMLILEEINQGTFNDVQRVYHLGLHKEVVLRKYNFSRVESRYGYETAKQEADKWNNEVQTQIWLQSNVPSVLKILETYPNERALLLEDCAGSLTDFAEHFKPLLKETRILILKQMVNWVAEMHKKHIVHGDIKTENILYIENPTAIEIRGADYGLTQPAYLKTAGGTGTPKYLPFEAFLYGNKGAFFAKQLDSWALGITAYELKYGLLDLHEDIAIKIFDFKTNFRNTVEWISFYKKDETWERNSVGPRPTSIPKNRDWLVRVLALRYPEAQVELQKFQKTREFYDLPRLDFYNSLYNAIVIGCYQNAFQSIFRSLCQQLLTGDSEDQFIAQMINPDPKSRCLAEISQLKLYMLDSKNLNEF